MSNEVDSVNSGALATVIGIVALSTLGVALVVTALVRDETKTVLSVKDLTQENGVRGLRADQRAQLNAMPAWVSKKDQTVSLPIERAMALTVAQVRKNPAAFTPGSSAPAAADSAAVDSDAVDSASVDSASADSTEAVPTSAEAAPAPAAPTAQASAAPAPAEKAPAAQAEAAPKGEPSH